MTIENTAALKAPPFQKVPPRIGSAPEAADEAAIAFLKTRAAADISDVVGPLYTLDPAIRALTPAGGTMVGQAVTVKAAPGDNRAIVGAMGFAGKNQVLVVDWRGYVGACGSGALSLATPVANGLAGVVIDGAWRDLAEVEELGLPLFGRCSAVYSPAKAHLGEVNVPVHCGGVVIEPGDLIVGDGEGVAVIPARHIGDVVAILAAKKSADVSPEALRGRAEARHVAFLADIEKAGGGKV
ncbi:RraA family protein [Martelella sp. HB161492]|uniref:RraA family protein n=1 Tax=Martelella sp. HB161492 TaxID=2720726 RepID=UPI00158FC825|nr:RraA family protein [Martelella sp. HB161492]